MIIAAVTHQGAMTSRLLSTPVLLWIGTRSYGLYLFHWPIYQMIRNIAGNKMKFHEFAIAMVLAGIVTELSYRYIETPIRTGALRRMWRGGTAAQRSSSRTRSGRAGGRVRDDTRTNGRWCSHRRA